MPKTINSSLPPTFTHRPIARQVLPFDQPSRGCTDLRIAWFVMVNIDPAGVTTTSADLEFSPFTGLSLRYSAGPTAAHSLLRPHRWPDESSRTTRGTNSAELGKLQ